MDGVGLGSDAFVDDGAVDVGAASEALVDRSVVEAGDGPFPEDDGLVAPVVGGASAPLVSAAPGAFSPVDVMSMTTSGSFLARTDERAHFLNRVKLHRTTTYYYLVS